MDLPSVNLNELRERGIVVRCANFSVDALRSDETKKEKRKTSPLPVVTSDKKTFNIPDDVYNPAFQVSITLYHYPDKCGSKFLCKFSQIVPLGTVLISWVVYTRVHACLYIRGTSYMHMYIVAGTVSTYCCCMSTNHNFTTT